MAGMRLAAPLLALKLGYSAVHVGFLLALFSLSQVFLALPAGRYADRHGLRRPMGLGVVVAMVGALLSLVFPVFGVLCVSALCMGAATGGASIALQRHVGRAAADTNHLDSRTSVGRFIIKCKVKASAIFSGHFRLLSEPVSSGP